VIILSTWPDHNFKSVFLKTLPTVRLTFQKDGRGTLLFGSSIPTSYYLGPLILPGARKNLAPAFDSIENARAVYNLLQKAALGDEHGIKIALEAIPKTDIPVPIPDPQEHKAYRNYLTWFASTANLFAWIVFVGHILYAGVHFIEVESTYIQQTSSGIDPQIFPDARKNPVIRRQPGV
jgi:hypothetical protein